MPDPSPNWTDIVSTIAVTVEVVILGFAAGFAWRQVGEARRLREEQTRPFVVIDFEIERHLAFLQVSNIGPTLARNVRFEIEPPLRSATISTVGELKMLREGISTLAPGKKIRTLFDDGPKRSARRDEFPDTYAVTARYSDETGRREFTETLDLDLGIFWNIIRSERREVHDVHERLKDMLAEMRKWTSGTGRGVLRLSPEEAQAEHERRLGQVQERRARSDQAPTEPDDAS
jgi:hypothetical protein